MEKGTRKEAPKGTEQKETLKNMKKTAASKAVQPAFTAPFLVIAVMVLIKVGMAYVARTKDSGENVFLSLSIVQIIAFLIPSFVYYQIKRRKFSADMPLSPMRTEQIPFTVFVCLMFVAGGMLIRYYLYGFFDTGVDTLGYKGFVSSNSSQLQIVISLAVVPSICEELFFRGVILSEYRCYGTFNAIVMSSIAFSMIHFSFEGLPLYLFSGVVLGILTVVCRSVFPGMLIHIVNNVIDLYGGEIIMKSLERESGTYFVKFILTVLFLLSLWQVLSGLQGVYLNYAERPPKENRVEKKARTNIYFSVSFLILVAIYITVTLISR